MINNLTLKLKMSINLIFFGVALVECLSSTCGPRGSGWEALNQTLTYAKYKVIDTSSYLLTLHFSKINEVESYFFTQFSGFWCFGITWFLPPKQKHKMIIRQVVSDNLNHVRIWELCFEFKQDRFEIGFKTSVEQWFPTFWPSSPTYKSYKNVGPTMKNYSYSLASNVVVCLNWNRAC